ncbi:MAG: polysaccharide deacetylase family protein, partial [Acidobacteriota bacterium]
MTVSILLYHEISGIKAGAHPYAVSVEAFEKQLQYLKAHQYRTILIAEYVEAEQNNKRDTDNRVILTFDDTHISNYVSAFPLLMKYGYCAEFFVVTKFIGRERNVLNRQQLIQMSDHGMSIQSHTHTHAFLNELSRDQIYSELMISKQIVEEIVGKRVTGLSCPGGRYTRSVVSIAQDVGYERVCVSRPGVRGVTDDMKVLGRFLVTSGTDLDSFWKIVERDRAYVARKILEYQIKGMLKKVLRNGLYDKVW